MAYEELSTEKSLLSGIRKLAANFGKARGFQYLDITGGTASQLTVPDNCHYAQIAIKTATPSTTVPVAWYRMDGGTAAVNAGLPVYNQTTIDVSDYENLKNFSIIGTTGGEKVYIQYFNIQY